MGGLGYLRFVVQGLGLGFIVVGGRHVPQMAN